MLAAVPASPSTMTAATDAEDDGDDEEERRRGQVHPVRPEVEDDLLAVVEVLLGEGHGRSVARPPGGAGCSAPTELVQPVVVDAEVVADLVDDGGAHLRRPPRASVRQAARIARR